MGKGEILTHWQIQTAIFMVFILPYDMDEMVYGDHSMLVGVDMICSLIMKGS